MSSYPIQGIPLTSPDRPLPRRREIDERWNDQDCAAEHALFVRALTEFKELTPLDEVNGKLSYYQIAGLFCNLGYRSKAMLIPAGIHGMPNQP